MATTTTETSDPHRVQRELITGSIVIAAIVMFIWTGGSAMTAVVRYLTGVGPNVEQILLTALLLNIALILFGWRRYRDLQIEVQQRREAEERARVLAETDSLTGFLNRRSMTEKGAELLKQAQQTHQSVAVLLLDLDNFKAVNDVHGHAAGDQVLVTAAQRIKSLMEPSGLTARLGGDEFVCALAFDPRLPEQVDNIAKQLVNAMSSPMTPNGLHLRIGTSIGIARSDLGGDSIETLLKHADIAMYCAKRQGRNRYAWFDTSMERDVNVRNTLETAIRLGVSKSEFLPHYQPQVGFTEGRLIGFDIVPYWNHPVEGLVPPGLFAPVADESGLIAELSLGVMRRAFEEARSWHPSLRLSVHISPAQFKDSWFSQKICKLLLETGFGASRLDVGITEPTLFEDLEVSRSILGSLRNQGIGITLDDFGTGYGSLVHLRALPIDRIRISRSLTSSAGQSEENATIVGAIVRLADNMGIPVIADGVENEGMRDHMKELGCAQGQGPLFGPAMPIERALRLLLERDLLVSPIDNSRHPDGDRMADPDIGPPERKAL